MGKKLTYMVLDCETATLPISKEIARNAEESKKLSIALPLIYDIGWVIVDRKGNIIKSYQSLVAEIFSVPSIFNTAYYAEKRPLYLEMLKKGETRVRSWNEIMEEFVRDLQEVNFVGAYNSMFDFKKAIPYTELYISKLYSPDYYNWEEFQKKRCFNILNGIVPEEKRPFEPEVFRFRKNEYALFDVWGMACKYLLNSERYKSFCAENMLFSPSGEYFSTNAENTFRYLMKDCDFIESHTALDDAIIESKILVKMLREHGISVGIDYFPFRMVGKPVEHLENQKQKKRMRKREAENLLKYLDCLADKLDEDKRKKVNANIARIKKVLN